MPPPKKKPPPMPTLLTAISSSEQRDRLEGLRVALSLAKVPGAQAAKVVEQQELVETVVGYVETIRSCHSSISGLPTNIVQVYGLVESKNWHAQISFSFPPNDPMYLAEFLRAQTNPHLRVTVVIGDISKVPFEIACMAVESDWRLPPLQHQPNFDLVEIKR